MSEQRHDGYEEFNVRHESKLARKMRAYFQREMIGQERAIRYLVDGLEIYQAGLRNPRRPIFTALLLGPTGAGKTFAAQLLAGFLFKNKNGLTKIQCTKYVHGHEVADLSGAPPGYLGHTTNPVQLKLSQFNIDKHDFLARIRSEDAGKLMNESRYVQQIARLIKNLEKDLAKLKASSAPGEEKRNEQEKHLQDSIDNFKQNLADIDEALEVVHNGTIADEQLYVLYQQLYNPRRPCRSVILFDELEKASEPVYNQLLSISDEGEYEVGGRTTSFHHSFILMTSNIGRKEIRDILEGNEAKIGYHARQQKAVHALDREIYSVAEQAARNHFAPEFLARVDKIIVFRPFVESEFAHILDVELKKFTEQLVVRAHIALTLDLTPEARAYIIAQSHKLTFMGARAIERRLDRYLRAPLARLKNTGKLRNRDVIRVDYQGGKFTFRRRTKKLFKSE